MYILKLFLCNIQTKVVEAEFADSNAIIEFC